MLVLEINETCFFAQVIVEDVKLTLGSALAFNDLPTTIKAEFILTNARPWGLQEILASLMQEY
jgi:hypothetical protein